MTSCHHGDALRQNNLDRAMRVLDANKQIKVFEIDFVQVGDDFVSSHDYTPENVANGSSLKEWVDVIVLRGKKILWIDVKSHIDFLAFACCCDVRFKFDCRALFNALMRLCKQNKRRLQDHVWLSCQDSQVRDTMIHYNNTRIKERHRWLIATDIPFVESYAYKLLLPQSVSNWLNEHVFFSGTFMTLDYTSSRALIVCIDRSFFSDTTKLIRFIEASTIPPGSTIVLYTFPNETKPIEVLGYKIIMQYDYTVVTETI